MTKTEAPVALIPKSPAETAKALLVIAVTLFASVRASLGGGISPVEGVQLIIQAITLVPVFLLSGTAVKTIAAFALAGLQALVVPLSVLAGWNEWGAVTFDDWSGAIIAAFLAVGIAVIPNAQPKVTAITHQNTYVSRLTETGSVTLSGPTSVTGTTTLSGPLTVEGTVNPDGPDHRA